MNQNDGVRPERGAGPCVSALCPAVVFLCVFWVVSAAAFVAFSVHSAVPRPLVDKLEAEVASLARRVDTLERARPAPRVVLGGVE